MTAHCQALDENEALARLFEETADLLEAQGANRFRVRAYRAAAGVARSLDRPARQIYEEGGLEALAALPHIGETLSKAMETWFQTGTLGILHRLRGEEAAESVLTTIPGFGDEIARRIHSRLGITTLEDLELALHDGSLAQVPGIGPRRLRMIQNHLAARLRRQPAVPGEAAAAFPSAAEILDVDREYRQCAPTLPRIAPRRQNPSGEAWLPVLHTVRGPRNYTALFSNTARAHELGRTRDWVVIYLDQGPGSRWTVVTETHGPLAGKRVVRGREAECGEYHAP